MLHGYCRKKLLTQTEYKMVNMGSEVAGQDEIGYLSVFYFIISNHIEHITHSKQIKEEDLLSTTATIYFTLLSAFCFYTYVQWLVER